MKAFLSCCILSAFVSVSSLAATPQYKTRTDITTGFKLLYGMAVADFNGDGKPDIAATDNNSKNLYVYLNDGAGSFGAPKLTALTMAALDSGQIVAGDFNEDGKQDILIATVAGQQSTLFLTGNGDGTFTQQPDLPNSFGLVSSIVADINQDKHLDLISGGNGSLAIYTGDGRGNFQQVTAFAQGNIGLFTGMASEDFNKDGKLDFVAVSPVQTAGIRYYEGYGDSTFASPTLLQNSTLSAPGSIAAADFDGDKNTDLLVSSGLFAYIISGAGNGTFDLTGATRLLSPSFSITQPISNPVVSPWVAATDLDGDGSKDVVTANTYITTLGILINDGTGKFPLSLADFTHTIDVGTSQLNTADLNGDGLPDIILANNKTQNISIFLSIKPKTTPTLTLASSTASSFVGASVNLTAKVTGANNTVPTSTVTLMEGSTSLGQQTLDANGQALFSLSSLSAGQHTLSAVYAGDSNYNTVTGTALTQAITDMQIAFSTTSQTVTAGTAANYTVTLTPVAGLSGTATLTCSQLPSLVTCDPSIVTLSGQPATATLTVHTTAPVRSQQSSRTGYAAAFLPLLAVYGLSKRRRIVGSLLALSMTCALGCFLSGCSSGSSSSTSTPATVTPGTPTGTSTFTLTSTITAGSQTLTRSTTATLIVQ